MRTLLASLLLLTACGDKSNDTADATETDRSTETDTASETDHDGPDEEEDDQQEDDDDCDGAGNPDRSVWACAAPDGTVPNPADCDDGDAAVHPRAEERCDTVGTDDDCDRAIDEDDAVDAAAWYPDADADGFGDTEAAVYACAAPADHIADGSDCDDGAPDVYPGAPEICDGQQCDCDDSTWTSDARLASFQADGDTAWSDVATDLGGAGSTELTAVKLDTAGTLALCEGTWALDLEIAADVDIVGKGDPEAVVVSGLDQTTVVDLSTDNLTASLTDLTVADGYGDTAHPYSSSWTVAGAISCQAESALTVSGVVFSGHNAGTNGAVLGAESCDVVLADVTVRSDRDDTKHDLVVQYGGSLVIDGGDWNDIVADRSLVDVYGADLTVQNIDFDGVVVDAAFFACDGDWGDVDGATITASNVTVSNSDTGYDSVFNGDSDDCTISISDSTFPDNTGHDGVVASLLGTGKLTLDNVTATGNIADNNGVVLTEYADIEIVDSTFSDNFGEDSGSMYLYRAPSIIITDTVFSGNTGEDRGTLWLDFGDDDTTYTLDGVEFDDNTAVNGGCIYHRGGTLALIDTTFTECSASENGGVLYLEDGTVTGTGSSFSGSSTADAYVDAMESAYTLGAEFSCTDAGCETL